MSDVKRLLDGATSLPWATNAPDGGLLFREMPDGRWIAPPIGSVPPHDAALIVHAVNHLPDYEAAVHALESMLDWAERYRGGDEKLHAEEYYIRRDEASAALRRLRDEMAA